MSVSMTCDVLSIATTASWQVYTSPITPLVYGLPGVLNDNVFLSSTRFSRCPSGALCYPGLLPRSGVCRVEDRAALCPPRYGHFFESGPYGSGHDAVDVIYRSQDVSLHS